MEELVDDFLSYLRNECGRSQHTQKTYAALLGRFLAWAKKHGLTDWKSVELSHLTKFLEHERERTPELLQALTDGQAAHLIAITCSTVPDGHDHWTVRMLAGQAVELGYVRRISPETVRQLLKKTR